jgi:hypothetical protein
MTHPHPDTAEYLRRFADRYIMLVRFPDAGHGEGDPRPRRWMVLAERPRDKDRQHFYVPRADMEAWKAPFPELKCTQWFVIDETRHKVVKAPNSSASGGKRR